MRSPAAEPISGRASRPVPAETAPERPLVGVTIGDPAGVGPDVALAAARDAAADLSVVLIGDAEMLRRRAAGLELDLVIDTVSDVDDARRRAQQPATVACLATGPDLEGLVPGRPRSVDGRAALEYIRVGAELANSGAIDALTTAPVSKDAIALHQPGFLGHTEYLAGRTGARQPTMLFAAPRVRSAPTGADIALLSTHLPLATALTLVRTDLIAAALTRLSHQWRTAFGREPSIGLAALNPHAGESGRIGTEESRVLSPAVALARESGVTASGPFPADSIFLRPGLDVIVALYHDQGTIMAKRAPWPTVNVTLGLPWVRTSPDHGTAYELAATGRADTAAMSAAIRLAGALAAGTGRAAQHS